MEYGRTGTWGPASPSRRTRDTTRRAASGSRTPWVVPRWPRGRPRTRRSGTHHYHPGTDRPVRPSEGGNGARTQGQTDVATRTDLKHGMTRNIDGQLWNVVDSSTFKPGKGGAFVRTRLRHHPEKVVDGPSSAGSRSTWPNVDNARAAVLLRGGRRFVFMDTRTRPPSPRIPRTEAWVRRPSYLPRGAERDVACNAGTAVRGASSRLGGRISGPPGVKGDGFHRPAKPHAGARRAICVRCLLNGRNGEGGHPDG